jgi:hypothetical protein
MATCLRNSATSPSRAASCIVITAILPPPKSPHRPARTPFANPRSDSIPWFVWRLAGRGDHMDIHPYINNDHPATPSLVKHPILVSHLSRPRSRGSTSRRVHMTCASSTPTPHHHNRCQEPPAPLHERELSTAARSPTASQRTYLACDPRHCCTNTVVCGSPLVVHVTRC